MSESTPLLCLEGLTKVYRMGEVDVHALKATDLKVETGEFIVILGPSGCGKSTLMNLIGGLDTPSSGRVLVYGRDIAHMNEAQQTLYRRDTVGFIFQFFNLVNTLTARENIQLAAELAQKPLGIDEVLRAVGLEQRGDHFPSELSGGEQQRVAIARALVKRPPILLCDEPTGELDFETGRMILAVLRNRTRENKQTVLLVTHNAATAAIADRVIRLSSGSIISDQRNAEPLDPMELKW